MSPSLAESPAHTPAVGGSPARSSVFLALVAFVASLPCARPGFAQAGDEPDPGPEAAPGAEETEVPESDEGQVLQEEVGYPIHGSSTSRYRGRTTSDETDHEFYQTLYLDLGDEERHPFTFHLSGLGTYDLDGQEKGDDTFFGGGDTFDSRAHGRLYEAYAEAHGTDDFETLRVGRQMMYTTPEFVWFDGVHLETREKGDDHVSLGAYGGVPVHVFESSPSGDSMYGLYGQVRPWEGGRLRVDWLRLEDENFLGEHDNDLLGFELWQSLADNVNLTGSYSRLDNENRDYRVRGTYTDFESELTLQASYYELLETQRDLAFGLDPFFDSLIEFFPYYQTQVLASKGVGEDVALQAGADVRRVSDGDDVGAFNRDFERYYLTTVVQDVFTDGLELSLTGETWDGDDNDVRTWGLNATKDLSERLDASLGTFYSLYKYDFLLNEEERNDVRTYYMRLKFKQTKDLRFDFRYEFESGEFDDYHTVRLGMTRRF